jgi:hypothetical protein
VADLGTHVSLLCLSLRQVEGRVFLHAVGRWSLATTAPIFANQVLQLLLFKLLARDRKRAWVGRVFEAFAGEEGTCSACRAETSSGSFRGKNVYAPHIRVFPDAGGVSFGQAAAVGKRPRVGA